VKKLGEAKEKGKRGNCKGQLNLSPYAA